MEQILQFDVFSPYWLVNLAPGLLNSTKNILLNLLSSVGLSRVSFKISNHEDDLLWPLRLEQLEVQLQHNF